MAQPLAAALKAKKVDDAVRLWAEMQTSGTIEADARTLAALATLAACNRHNETAWTAYSHGKSVEGLRTMRGAGINFNAVLYACCRDPAMCEKALSVWDDMAAEGVAPELEPLNKLMLSCLARGRYDDGFRIFLAAMDANLQPPPPVCLALLRTCGVAPRLATMAYAVFVTMKGASAELPQDALLTLLRGCVKTGTLEQVGAARGDGMRAAASRSRPTSSRPHHRRWRHHHPPHRHHHPHPLRFTPWPAQAFDVYDFAFGAAGAPPPPPEAASELIVRCAQEAQPARGAALARALAARAAGGEGAEGAVGGHATAAAYNALLGSYCRLSLARSNPAHAAAAAALLEEMQGAAGRGPAERPLIGQIVLACARTNQPAKALGAFDALREHPETNAAAPLEPAVLRALVLAVGKAAAGAGAGAGAAVSAEHARALLAAQAGAASLDEEMTRLDAAGALGTLDKEIGGALVRIATAAGLLRAARAVLERMCEQAEPPAPPGSALLGVFVGACAKHADAEAAGAEAARAFDALAPHRALAPAAHGEIWACLLPVCCRARRAADALRLFSALREAGAPPAAAAAAEVLAALREQGLAKEAFELEASLAAGGAAPLGADGGAAPAPPVTVAAPSAASGAAAMEVDGEGGEEPGGGGGGSGDVQPAAAAAAAAAAAGLTPAEHEASLAKLLTEALAQKRIEPAVQLVRQCAAAGLAPAEASVLQLLQASWPASPTAHAGRPDGLHIRLHLHHIASSTTTCPSCRSCSSTRGGRSTRSACTRRWRRAAPRSARRRCSPRCCGGCSGARRRPRSPCAPSRCTMSCARPTRTHSSRRGPS